MSVSTEEADQEFQETQFSTSTVMSGNVFVGQNEIKLIKLKRLEIITDRLLYCQAAGSQGG